MPPELSMRAREEVADGDLQGTAEPTPTSRFEKQIIKGLCQPVLPLIPASIHPNTISLANHFVGWITFGLALVSVHLPPVPRGLALFAAGVGMLVSMIGDCLDGMHARRTNQCSKLGEMLDHWLDALIVPMVTVGMSMALEMEPWAIVTVNITAVMVYHGQLVLYHHTGEFLHPEAATGVEAQFGVSVGYMALALFFSLVDRHQLWLDVAVGGVAVLGLIIQMRCNWFYYRRLGRFMDRHLVFVAMCSGFGVLHLVGALDLYAFVFAIVFVSFRICGKYVLYTVVRQPYDGHDHGIAIWIVAIAAAHFGLPLVQLGPVTLQGLLPYLACGYMGARNLIEFARYYPELRPAA